MKKFPMSKLNPVGVAGRKVSVWVVVSSHGKGSRRKGSCMPNAVESTGTAR
jgi:hypothetical protein